MARKGGIDRGIFQRKDRNGYTLRIALNGRERSFTCDTKTQARALRGRLKAEQREGKYFEKPVVVPFRVLAEEYVHMVDARRRRKGDDTARLRRWLMAFGDQDAKTITVRQIEKVLTELQKDGLEPATLLRHLAVLKAIFNRGKRVGLVKENPARLVKPPQVNNVLVRYLTPDQETRLFACLPEKYRPIVLMALHTGLRQGELLRLTWGDIDWNAGVVTIHETKAGERRRTPMNSIVVGLLSGLKTEPSFDSMGRMFPFGARYVGRVFERAVQAAGLVPFRFHDLRHTFASRLAMQGANDRTLMALGGWKSPAMLGRYAHLSPTYLWKAVEGLTQLGTVTKTGTEDKTQEEETRKLLKNVVSRLGLEPRTLALKGRCSTN